MSHIPEAFAASLRIVWIIIKTVKTIGLGQCD